MRQLASSVEFCQQLSARRGCCPSTTVNTLNRHDLPVGPACSVDGSLPAPATHVEHAVAVYLAERFGGFRLASVQQPRVFRLESKLRQGARTEID
jgi:hypothetical protein